MVFDFSDRSPTARRQSIALLGGASEARRRLFDGAGDSSGSSGSSGQAALPVSQLLPGDTADEDMPAADLLAGVDIQEQAGLKLHLELGLAGSGQELGWGRMTARNIDDALRAAAPTAGQEQQLSSQMLAEMTGMLQGQAQQALNPGSGNSGGAHGSLVGRGSAGNWQQLAQLEVPSPAQSMDLTLGPSTEEALNLVRIPFPSLVPSPHPLSSMGASSPPASSPPSKEPFPFLLQQPCLKCLSPTSSLDWAWDWDPLSCLSSPNPPRPQPGADGATAPLAGGVILPAPLFAQGLVVPPRSFPEFAPDDEPTAGRDEP